MEKYSKMQCEEVDNKENNTSVNTNTHRSHYIDVLSKQSSTKQLPSSARTPPSASLLPSITETLATHGAHAFRSAALAHIQQDATAMRDFEARLPDLYATV